jgi:hypothetical protein
MIGDNSRLDLLQNRGHRLAVAALRKTECPGRSSGKSKPWRHDPDSQFEEGRLEPGRFSRDGFGLA